MPSKLGVYLRECTLGRCCPFSLSYEGIDFDGSSKVLKTSVTVDPSGPFTSTFSFAWKFLHLQVVHSTLMDLLALFLERARVGRKALVLLQVLFFFSVYPFHDS